MKVSLQHSKLFDYAFSRMNFLTLIFGHLLISLALVDLDVSALEAAEEKEATSEEEFEDEDDKLDDRKFYNEVNLYFYDPSHIYQLYCS